MAANSSQAAQPPKPPPLPANPLSPTEAVALVTGNIRPVGTTLGYRLSLALVGVVMLLLPLIYVAMIIGVGWGVWWHLVHDVGMLTDHELRGKAALMVGLAYVAPAFIGTVLVAFMVKPLLARRPKDAEPRSLRPEDEPTLFAFVNRICEAVGAPFPKRIDIDLNVNASASYRRGLASVMRNDLVLTIGLPLAAGMSVEQFAGILAHEFGHFTQAAGMGFGAVIHRINDWFARVVWQRDAWDVWLEEWSKAVDLRLAWILWLARGGIWLTRRILFGLMWVAHALSCHLSRQMEYDADLHQARLVGGKVVADTFRCLPRLSIAEQKAWQLLQESWFEGVLADSVPDLVVELSRRLSTEERGSIEKSVSEEKTAIFATHPADRERIARAAADGTAPVLVCGEPASRLFADFPRLCQTLSMARYTEALPGKVSPEQLRPVPALLSQQQAEKTARDAAERWLGGELIPQLPFPGTGALSGQSAEECLASLQDTRTILRLTPPQPAEALDGICSPLAKHRHTYLVESIVGAGQSHDDPHLGMSFHSIADVERFRQETWDDFRTRSAPLLERRRLVDRRLRAALGWLVSPEAEGKLPDAVDRRADVARLSRALVALTARQADWIPASGNVTALEFWLGYLAEHDLNEAARKPFADLLARTTAAIQAVRTPLLEEPYPLDHADRTMTIGRYLVAEEVPADAPHEVITAARQVANLFPWLGWQLVGRLILHAEAVEAMLLEKEPAG
jgi:Zn-dependent protease with chaperone function